METFSLPLMKNSVLISLHIAEDKKSRNSPSAFSAAFILHTSFIFLASSKESFSLMFDCSYHCLMLLFLETRLPAMLRAPGRPAPLVTFNHYFPSCPLWIPMPRSFFSHLQYKLSKGFLCKLLKAASKDLLKTCNIPRKEPISY